MTPDLGAALREAFLGLSSLLLERFERWWWTRFLENERGKESQNKYLFYSILGVPLSNIVHVSGLNI
jgi:hypothetical protein